nr:MAG TPA: hypothetical protein [Caudoviricetes sp.]
MCFYLFPLFHGYLVVCLSENFYMLNFGYIESHEIIHRGEKAIP